MGRTAEYWLEVEQSEFRKKGPRAYIFPSTVTASFVSNKYTIWHSNLKLQAVKNKRYMGNTVYIGWHPDQETRTLAFTSRLPCHTNNNNYYITQRPLEYLFCLCIRWRLQREQRHWRRRSTKRFQNGAKRTTGILVSYSVKLEFNSHFYPLTLWTLI